MKPDKHKAPLQENTKDDSSDVQRVRQDKQSPPPQSKANTQNMPSDKNKGLEDEEAEKGHA